MIRFTRYLLLIAGIISLGGCGSPEQRMPAVHNGKKILIIGTNTDTFNHAANGSYLVEILPPYNLFAENGFEVDIVTPKGGKLALYGEARSVSPSEEFTAKATQTLRPDQVKAKNYTAVFIPGGYGQFIDVYHNGQVLKLIATAYESGAWIGATGHGPASLVNVRLKDHTYLVAGKSMTCFPSERERAVMTVSNFGRALPFNMEKSLSDRGAFLAFPKGLSIVEDSTSHIITCSFADDAEKLAGRMAEILKANP